MDPLLGYGLFTAGSALAGQMLGRNRPSAPNYVGEAQGRGRTQQRRLDDRLRSRERDLEDRAASAGLSGAAQGRLRDDLFGQADQAYLGLSDMMADDLARAQNATGQAAYQDGMMRLQAQGAGLGSLMQGGALALSGMGGGEPVTEPVAPVGLVSEMVSPQQAAMSMSMNPGYNLGPFDYDRAYVRQLLGLS